MCLCGGMGGGMGEVIICSGFFWRFWVVVGEVLCLGEGFDLEVLN